MKPKYWMVLTGLTLGLATTLRWLYRNIAIVQMPSVSKEWLTQQEYSRDGFQD